MQIQRIPFELPPLEADPKRSQGLHLSQIIKSVLMDLNREKYDGPITESVLWKWKLGFMWEDVISQAYTRQETKDKPHLITQQEVTCFGIHMTPDAFDLKEWSLHEYKCTFKSSRHPIDGPEFRHWFWQMQAYCLAMETTVAWLHPLFLNGDYRGSGPIGEWQYRIEFTPRDIAENWQFLTSHAKAKGML